MICGDLVIKNNTSGELNVLSSCNKNKSRLVRREMVTWGGIELKRFYPYSNFFWRDRSLRHVLPLNALSPCAFLCRIVLFLQRRFFPRNHVRYLQRFGQVWKVLPAHLSCKGTPIQKASKMVNNKESIVSLPTITVETLGLTITDPLCPCAHNALDKVATNMPVINSFFMSSRFCIHI